MGSLGEVKRDAFDLVKRLLILVLALMPNTLFVFPGRAPFDWVKRDGQTGLRLTQSNGTRLTESNGPFDLVNAKWVHLIKSNGVRLIESNGAIKRGPV